MVKIEEKLVEIRRCEGGMCSHCIDLLLEVLEELANLNPQGPAATDLGIDE